jgi:hypothetical protein
MIDTILIILSGAVTAFTMATSSLHSDAMSQIASGATMLSGYPTTTFPGKIAFSGEESTATACASQQSSNADIRSKDWQNVPTFSSSFYMCCQANPNSITVDHYYPPYACIFGPKTGLCPQGVNSSFIFPWLCTVDSNWGVGQIVCVSRSCIVESITDIHTQNCTYNTPI